MLAAVAVLLFSLSLFLNACTQSTNTNTDSNADNTNNNNTTGSGSTSQDRVILQEGMAAPDFSFTTIDGKTGKLSDYKGQVVFINFWASWCGPCLKEMPDIASLQQQYPNIVFLAINVSDNADNAKAYIATASLKASWIIDNGDIFYLYPSDGIPYTLIIDKTGTISTIFLGSPTNALSSFQTAVVAAGAS